MKIMFMTDCMLRVLDTNLVCEEALEMKTLEKVVCWADSEIMLALEFKGGKNLKIITCRKVEIMDYISRLFTKK